MNGVRTDSGTRTTARAKVTLGDLAWLAWRQHRATLIGMVAAVAAMCGWMVWNLQHIARLPPRDRGPSTCGGAIIAGCRYSLGLVLGAGRGASGLGHVQVYLVVFYAALIAVFVAAPLVAREYEQRTNLLVWSQDVSPARWLAGMALPLGAVSVLLALALGALSDDILGRLADIQRGSVNLYQDLSFEAFAPLQAAYAVFGFALGLACGAWLRRVVPAMVATLAGFVGLRVLFSVLRFDYLPPERTVAPFTAMFTVPSSTYLDLGSGGLTALGQKVTQAPPACGVPNGYPGWLDCVHRHGVVAQFTDYQPADRLPAFRLIECGIYLVLAVGFGALAWWRMRRTD